MVLLVDRNFAQKEFNMLTRIYSFRWERASINVLLYMASLPRPLVYF